MLIKPSSHSGRVSSLFAFSSFTVAVYYSLDFSYANYEQSRARIRRIGQTKRGVYIHLVCKDTIDEKVMAALKQKADVSKLLVDDYKKIIGG